MVQDKEQIGDSLEVITQAMDDFDFLEYYGDKMRQSLNAFAPSGSSREVFAPSCDDHIDNFALTNCATLNGATYASAIDNWLVTNRKRWMQGAQEAPLAAHQRADTNLKPKAPTECYSTCKQSSWKGLSIGRSKGDIGYLIFAGITLGGFSMLGFVIWVVFVKKKPENTQDIAGEWLPMDDRELSVMGELDDSDRTPASVQRKNVDDNL